MNKKIKKYDNCYDKNEFDMSAHEQIQMYRHTRVMEMYRKFQRRSLQNSKRNGIA